MLSLENVIMNTDTYPTRFLHTMLRVENLECSIKFYTEIMGMRVLRRKDYEDGQFTLVFLGYGSEDRATVLELTYNWDKQSYQKGTAFGHIALAVSDIYETCEQLSDEGIIITRKPASMAFDKNEVIAFVEDPDGYKIELIEKN